MTRDELRTKIAQVMMGYKPVDVAPMSYYWNKAEEIIKLAESFKLCERFFRENEGPNSDVT